LRRYFIATFAVVGLFVIISVCSASAWPLAATGKDKYGEWLNFDGFETRLLQCWNDYGPALDTWNGDRITTTDLNRPLHKYEDEPERFAKMATEYRFDDNIRRTNAKSHSGKWSLQIVTRTISREPTSNILQANVTGSVVRTLFWVKFRDQSRIRFWFHGCPSATGARLEMFANSVSDNQAKQIPLSLSDSAADESGWKQIISAPLSSVEGLNAGEVVGFTLRIKEKNSSARGRTYFLDDVEISQCLPEDIRLGQVIADSAKGESRTILVGFRGRKRGVSPTLLFNDLRDWKLYTGGGWNARLQPSNEEPLYEDTPITGKRNGRIFI